MEKRLKGFISFAAVAMLLSFTACGKKGITVDYDDCFALKYDAGSDEYGNFDSDKFSYNALDALGADPGAIYVSKEDDPVYGGYFYAYITGATKSGFTAGTGILPDDTAGLAFQCMRSEDLSVWEICGAANGYSLVGLESDWEEWGNSWAPEVIYNANDTEYPYYMYYTTPSEIRSSGRLTSSVNNTYNMRMHIGIARSKTPVGPFYTCSDTETVNGTEQKVPYNVCIDGDISFVRGGNIYRAEAHSGIRRRFRKNDRSLRYRRAIERGGLYGKSEQHNV